jgi:hypothetical protein
MADHYKVVSGRMLGFDKQIQKLEKFDQLFNQAFTPAVKKAITVSTARAIEISPNGITGKLDASIKGRMLPASKAAVSGKIVVGDVFGKALAIEKGRNYIKDGETKPWKGKYYLHFGVKDNKDDILDFYAVASSYLTSQLAVTAGEQ